MNIKASGRSALIIAAGIWICFAGPMRATESDARTADSSAKADSAEPRARAKTIRHRHARAQASTKLRKADKDAARMATDKKSDEADAAADRDKTLAIPASVANANAQLAANAPTDTRTISTQAGNVLKTMGVQPAGSAPQQGPDANMQVVAADQLNDLDRALSDDKPGPVLAAATIAPSVIVSRDNSAWDQTSFIGKVFIAFGGLLTMASAARMFMA